VEAAETVDPIGLITKATELIALIACTALWSRASHDHQPDQEKSQMEVG
jgi:hypothetical protein